MLQVRVLAEYMKGGLGDWERDVETRIWVELLMGILHVVQRPKLLADSD